MSTVTRERVEEMIEQQHDEFENNKYQAEHWQRGPRDLLAALTRLLALEDALKEAGPALEAGAVALVNASFAVVRNPEYSPKCEKRAAQLRALAALGGDK